MVDKGKEPLEPTEMDADIIWRFDLREELGVFPHNIASSSVLILGDLLFVRLQTVRIGATNTCPQAPVLWL